MGVYLDPEEGDELPAAIPDLPDVPTHPASTLEPGRLREIIDDVARSADAIPAGADAALVGSVTRDEWVGAFLVRSRSGWHFKAWVGQEDGARVDYGLGVLKTFKF